MIIREPRHADALELSGLMDDLGYPTSKTQMQTRMLTIQNDSNYQTLVAESQGVLIGMIGLFKGFSYEKDEPYVRIIALVVKEKYRKQGVGQALVTHAEDWADQVGAHKIAVNTSQIRTQSRAFYTNRGFVDSGVGFYKVI